MDRSSILSNLNQYKKQHRNQYGIKRIGLFGSVVREENRGESDVDVVVELERQDLFILIGIKQDLEESMGIPVDIVSYRNNMNPFLKRRIDSEAIYA